MSSPVDAASLLQGGALPQQPAPQQAQPVQPPAPTPTQPAVQALGQMGAPQQPGPQQNGNPSVVKSLLTNFFYGFGQSALHAAGMPTDYEKQQNQIKLNQRQAEINNTAQETQSLVALHQQQLAQQKDEYTPVALPAELAKITGVQSVYKKDLPAILQRVQSGQNIQDAAGQQLPVDDATAAALGLPPGTAVPKGLVPVLGRVAALKQTQWVSHDEGGVAGQINKITGEFRPSVGPNGKPMQANGMVVGPHTALARAAATPFSTLDTDMNPTTISNLDAIRGGVPKMTEGQTMNLSGDQLGVNTYLNANAAVRNNISVLRDPAQKAIIARATEEVDRNPGAIDSIVNSAIQDGLSPQGAKLIASMKQMNEFGSTFKKYTGNGGAATDSLRALIHSNQPSTSNSEATNLNLLDQDEQLARGVQKNLQRPLAHLPSAHQPAPLNPQAAPTADNPFAQFGGAPRR